MKRTTALKENDIHALESAAHKFGAVELAIAIGIGKSTLYSILNGKTEVTEETWEKITSWLNGDANNSTKGPAGEPGVPGTRIWDDPVFLETATIELCKAIRDGRLRDVAIILGGHCKCGD